MTGWRSHAFGLALQADFEPAGWPSSPAPHGLPKVSLAIDEREMLCAERPADAETIAWRKTASGREKPLILADAQAGYWLEAAGFGVFHVSSRATRIRCGQVRTAAWRWQRFLIAQVLPFACTVRGYEPWHASAVVVDGRAVAVAGPSASGKSTIAAELVLRGARLLSDDVLALMLRTHPSTAPTVVAHPAPGLMSLRPAAIERLGADAVRRLGIAVGADSRGMRIAVERCENAAPLRTLYLLEPARLHGQPHAELLRAPDPRKLLASNFTPALRDPKRLVRQLDVCAGVARSARIVRLRLPFDADHGAVADRLLADINRARERPAA